MAKKKSYAENVYGHIYESGNYGIDPDYFNSESHDAKTPTRLINQMFDPIVTEKRRILPLTDEQINNGGTNAALSLAYHKESPTIPTYGGGALLPELTITPRGTYIADGLHNHRFRRSLEKRGGIVRIY